MINLTQQVLTWIVSLSIVVGVIALLFIVFLIIKAVSKKEPKKETVKVDDEFINSLTSSLGGYENVLDVSIDNGRLKFLCNDLDLVKTEELKALSTSGVFITGKNVKLLFKYDSESIIKLFKERRG